MKNNELNMETLKQVNGGATEEYIPAEQDRSKELKELEELVRRRFEELRQERAPLRELEELLKKAV